MQRLTRIVNDPAWIAETIPGQITLRSALAMTTGAVPPIRKAASYYKPFVMAIGGAVMNLTHATLFFFAMTCFATTRYTGSTRTPTAAGSSSTMSWPSTTVRTASSSPIT
jgi:hypothetical protein